MNRDQNKAVVRGYIEMWNTGNAARAATLLAATFVDHAHPEIGDLQSFVQSLQHVRSSFPDFQITIDTMISEDEWVAVRATIGRTVQAQLRISRVIWFVRLVNGKMTELWTGTQASQ